jgi:hypothetical protein
MIKKEVKMTSDMKRILEQSKRYEWRGGLPEPNGYSILDENQAQIHMTLSRVVQYLNSKKAAGFDANLSSILKDYIGE